MHSTPPKQTPDVLFRVISSDDWRRGLASARARRSSASERLRASIASVRPAEQVETIGNTSGNLQFAIFQA